MSRKLFVFLCGLLLLLTSNYRNVQASKISSVSLEEDMVLGDEITELIGVVTTVVEDSKHFIYVADVGFQQVQKYSPQGALVDVFGSVGEGPGELMFPFVMAIDKNDQLYFAGQGGRVTIWTTDGTFVREFRRSHPDGIARSIRVAKDGRIYVAALDILNETVIDVYGVDGKYLDSFGRSYGMSKDIDVRSESFLGGGSLDLMENGMIAFTQQVPYRVMIFRKDGETIVETNKGGVDFLKLPPEPDFTKSTFKVSLGGSSVEITSLDHQLLNCALRTRKDTKTGETLLTLYDESLSLLARSVIEGSKIVVGSDAEQRVFIFSKDGDVPLVRRVRLKVQ